MQTFIDWFLTSFGLKRRLATLFQVLTAIAGSQPLLAPFAPLLQAIASWLGVAGIAHSTVAGTVFSTSPISTIAAFFAALDLLAKTLPVLQPYEHLIHTLASFFAMLATGSAIGGGKG